MTTDGEHQRGDLPSAEESARRTVALVRLVRETDRKSRVVRAVQWARGRLPGDPELGDALSTAGDDPSHLVARRLATAGAEHPSALRELGLGALQVWQALAESQGRGRGDREVAILFTDLVEFSSWALGAGDDAALELLRSVGQVSEDAIADHGGRVVKRLGDGLMAVFSDAQDAVAAAQQAVTQVCDLEVAGHRPQLRAGVHLGRPRKLGGDYLGIDVNVAARVAGTAKGGEVRVSGPTCERLDPDAFDLRRVRRFRAKGAPRELEVYAVRSGA